MVGEVLNWDVSIYLLNSLDYVIIRFDIAIERTELVENTALTGSYNLEKADWEKFHDILRTAVILLHDKDPHELTNKELKSYTTTFQKYIAEAAD